MRPFTTAIAAAVVAALASSASAGTSATANITLDTVVGPYNYYTITLHNTGDTNIGSFWYAWEPDINFMSSYPYITGSPGGWYGYSTGGGYLGGLNYDGYGIEWYNVFGSAIAAGDSATFSFYTSDTPAQLAGNSANHPGIPVQTSYVYQGFPESDPGFSFVVGAAAAPVPEPASLALLSGGILMLLRRRRR